MKLQQSNKNNMNREWVSLNQSASLSNSVKQKMTTIKLHQYQ